MHSSQHPSQQSSQQSSLPTRQQPSQLFNKIKQSALLTAFALGATLITTGAQATIVQFETSLGNFEVNLYDEATPATVTNFLSYLDAGAYDNTFFSRSVTDFVLQGGGWEYDDNNTFRRSIENAPAINEPVFSNVQGTIAMAKLPGNPNSATTEWFFNLRDNSANLDFQNQGFTVFGEITGDGMLVLEQVAALPNDHDIEPTYFNNMPLQNYTAGDMLDETKIVITNITVLDPTVDTASQLTPVATTNPVTTTSSGGGALNGAMIALFALLGFGRNKK